MHRTGVALACAAAILVSGCTPALSLHTAPLPDRSRAVITASPAGAGPVRPSSPITVAVRDGRLTDVHVEGPDGPLDGVLDPDLATWSTSDGVLAYGSRYRIVASAVDARGVATTAETTVETLEPKRTFDGEMRSPAPGSTVGVGMPITVAFDRKIKDRAAVEQALVVRTPVPVNGAWSWTDDRTVAFRPELYWPGNIDVEVELDLLGVEAAPDVYGRGDRTFDFSIGPSMVTTVDAVGHHADVVRDGELIKTIPITTGKTGFETRSGIKVIMTKERTRVMDAATTGTASDSPEYYRLNVEYAMRLTNSGEFVHAAPWSVRSQGFANVSHGCVGMSLENAAWLFDQSSIGDVVTVVGTDNPQNLGNGITVWNQTWDEWLAGSATGAHLTQTPAPLVGG